MPIHRCLAVFTALLCLLRPAMALAVPGSVEFFVNGAGSQNQDHGRQLVIPPGFGDGEFTFELWIRPNDSFPIGTVLGGEEQRTNWAIDDTQPYSTGSWWYQGNFLLDGHNNGDGFSLGTFSLQFYGGGRVRWLFGDGSGSIPTGGLWSVGAYPAVNTPTLLDGQWHQLTLVRRCAGQNSAQLELWIDGAIVGTETSNLCTNMRQWWDGWSGFGGAQSGWFWGAEKQAVVGVRDQYEDYKGLVDELRFWSRAKSGAEIAANYADPVTGSETGLVGHYAFAEAQGTQVCDSLAASRCIVLGNIGSDPWSADDAPLSSAGDTTAPTTPTNLQATAASASRVDLSWNPSSDNVGVTSYTVSRDGSVVGSTGGTTYSDTSVAADTSYSYTVSARDAAGNNSPDSAPASVTTPPSSDTEAPTAPTGLSGSAVSPSRIDLSWNAASDNVGVTGYVVRRDGSIVATPTGLSVSDTSAAANTTYSYTVSARDAAGNESPESAPVSVTTPPSSDTEAPTAPTGLSGSAVSPSRIDLSWNAASDNVGVTGYVVRRDGSVVTTVSGLSFSDTGLAANTSYSYTVTARDAAGNVSSESAPRSITTLANNDTQPPTAPTGLSGVAVSPSRIDLSWNPASDNVGVADYEIRRNGIAVAISTTTRYTDNGLAAGTLYTYTIVANDDAGNQSQPSASASIRTFAAPDNASSGGGGAAVIGELLALLLAMVRVVGGRLLTRILAGRGLPRITR